MATIHWIPIADSVSCGGGHRELKGGAAAATEPAGRLQDRSAKLTVRERDVISPIVSGMLTKQIASKSAPPKSRPRRGVLKERIKCKRSRPLSWDEWQKGSSFR